MIEVLLYLQCNDNQLKTKIFSYEEFIKEKNELEFEYGNRIEHEDNTSRDDILSKTPVPEVVLENTCPTNLITIILNMEDVLKDLVKTS